MKYMKNSLKSYIFSDTKNLFQTVAISLLLTLFACNQKWDTKISSPETNDSLKKIGRYYDDKWKNFYDNDQLKLALKNYITAAKYYEQTDEIKNRRWVTRDMGKIEYKQGNYEEALEYFQDALEILKDTNYLRGELLTNVAIAAVYNEQGKEDSLKYDMALTQYLSPGLEILRKQEDKDKKQKNLMVQYLVETGNSYFKKKNYENALSHRTEAKTITEEIGELQNIPAIYYNFGDLYEEQGEYDQVLENYQQWIQLSKEKNILTNERNGYEHVYFFYKKHTEDADSTLKYHELWILLKDSVANSELLKSQQETEIIYESEKKDKEIKLQKSELDKQSEKQKKLLWFIVAILATVLWMVIIGVRENRRKKQLAKTNKVINNQNIQLKEKNKEITVQRDEITAQRDEIEVQRDGLAESNKIIENQHREITDSINYATRIQKGVMTPLEEIKEIFPQSFIFFKPKDIVSGDFYRAAKNTQGKRFIAAPDCTGHGVPWAFMFLLNCDSLDDAVNRESTKTAADILNYANIYLPKKFHQEHKESEEGKLKDTMDVALCAIDENNMLEFALAKNPAILIRNRECIEFKEEKHAIGSGEYTYTNKSFQWEKWDVIYLFSDWFEDQFGWPKGKKFLVKQLKELFQSIADLPMEEQKIHLENTFESRRGNLEQVDDVLVIGFRV